MPSQVPCPIACQFLHCQGPEARHFEPIHAQIECEEEGKITIKMIPDLMNIPKWKDHGQNTVQALQGF
jgi:hypothetical protein